MRPSTHSAICAEIQLEHQKRERRLLARIDELTQERDRLTDALAAVQAPAVGAEREQLRAAQVAAVMPLIGPLLDAWEQADREVMDEEPELVKWLKAINTAMETAGEAEL